jgi:ElaB/YqjD/DUF883 family membrane-anchored ribosome-binding protein
MANSTVEDAEKVVEQKIDATREAMGDKAGRLRERVSEVADNVKARAGEVADKVKARAGVFRDRIAETEWADVQTGVKNYVRDNPGKSVGIALGVGFALGLLLRRRDD